MNLRSFVVALFATCFVIRSSCAEKEIEVDYSSDTSLFSTPQQGHLTAFADFSGNGATDILMTSKDKKALSVILFAKQGISFGQGLSMQSLYMGSKSLFNVDDEIINVVPGWFQGSNEAYSRELAVITQKKDQSNFRLTFWQCKCSSGCPADSIECTNKTDAQQIFGNLDLVANPIFADFNGDLRLDVLAREQDGFHLYVTQPQPLTTIEKSLYKATFVNATLTDYFSSDLATISIAPSLTQGLVDLDRDSIPDLFLTVDDSSFKIVYQENGKYNRVKDLPLPQEAISLCGEKLNDCFTGPIAFADMNSDHILNPILAVCEKDGDDCGKSQLFLLGGEKDDKEWISIFFGDTSGDTSPYRFAPDEAGMLQIHPGDYNLDGFVDFLLLGKNADGETQAIVLRNDVCPAAGLRSSKNMVCFGARHLSAVGDSGLALTKGASKVGFFDFDQSGALAIAGTGFSNGTLSVFSALINDQLTFLKISLQTPAASGVTNQMSLPGVATSYSMTLPSGDAKVEAATLQPRTAPGTLELPYTIYGLGRMPNYIETLTIGLPIPGGSDLPDLTDSTKFQRTQAMVIPNSHVIVIPTALGSETAWRFSVIVMWNNMIFYVLLILLGVTGICAITWLILHFRERKADQLEKETSPQFRFAMGQM